MMNCDIPPDPPCVKCEYCGEPIKPDDLADCVGANLHHECLFRNVGGSVAHVEKRCSCFVPGSNEGDPPGMTKRQAARAALERQRQLDLEKAKRN